MDLREESTVPVGEVLKTGSVSTAKKIIGARSSGILLGMISFLESALPLPILTDPFLMAAVALNKQHVRRLVLITTITSVLGGVCAFVLAKFFFDVLIGWFSPATVAEFHTLLAGTDSGIFILSLAGAVTPIPYTLVAWAVAVLQGSLLTFIVASIIGRGFRYVLVGYATYHFGDLAVQYVKRYITLITIGLAVFALLYFWWMH